MQKFEINVRLELVGNGLGALKKDVVGAELPHMYCLRRLCNLTPSLDIAVVSVRH